VFNDPPVNVAPGSNPDRELEEKRMIGDFDGSADALWSHYHEGAESHDKSRIQRLKEDMDGVPVFVRSYLSIPADFDRADSWQRRLVYFPPPLPRS